MKYGTDDQKTKPLDTSPALPKEIVKRIVLIIGKFLYYVRRVDNTCVFPISTMKTRKTPPNKMRKMYTHFWIKRKQIQMQWSDFLLQT